MKSRLLEMGRQLASAIILLAAALLVGCRSTSQLPPQPIPAQAGVPQTALGAPIHTNGNSPSPILKNNDLIIIDWSDTPTPMQQYKDRVRDDGNLVLPYGVVVKAAGLSASQLQDSIIKAYVPTVFRHLTATVKTEERFYFVGGEVRVPNRQYFYGDMTVLRAIDTAGGFTDFADRKKIELRRANGQTHKISWKDAMKDPKLDLPVYPNDQVIVHKRWL